MNIVIPFTFENLPVRGKLISIDSALEEIFKNKDYPDCIKKILSEFAVFAVYFGSSLKQKGSISIQFQTDGPLNLIFMECTSDLKIRGIAKYDEEVSMTTDIAIDSIEDSKLAINIISFDSDHTYQSLVPVSSSSVCDSFRSYIEQSEQIPTYLYSAYDSSMIRGIVLQYIPTEDEQENGSYNSAGALESLVQTHNDVSLFKGTGNEILSNLFSNHELRVFKSRAIEMKCTCSRSKVRELIRVLGEEDAHNLILEKGQIKVDCEMCGKSEVFDTIDVQAIFGKLASSGTNKTEH